ncbi:MAG TPA: hypothetical protein VNN09_05215 [Candidatus Competibacteraceae bacterium]|nr:hypothetical protein [Candidatus Competibacteraceae bacterium]
MCGTNQTTDLVNTDNPTIKYGTVSVNNDQDGNIYLTYTITAPRLMTASQWGIWASPADVPLNLNNSPQVGSFPYKATHSPSLATYTATVPLPAPFQIGDTLIIVARANLSDGRVGWAFGIRPDYWVHAFYFEYTVKPCTPPPPDGGFRTQTQGGWGTTCHGNNPGCYRDQNFEGTFPNGLTIGLPANNRSATFTTSLAIDQFLPAGGTPGILAQNYLNPTSTSAGVLAGQVVALTLSVGFDLNDPDFSSSSTNLKDLVVVAVGNACYGLTVAQVLEIANKVLGGDTTTGFSPSTINGCVTKINENYVDGAIDNGYLGLP